MVHCVYNTSKGGNCEALQPEGVLGCFGPNLYCVYAQTAISALPINILIPPVDSATLISYMVSIFCLSLDTYRVT